MVSALSPEAALYSMKKNTKNKERETDGDDELKRQLHFGTSSPPRRPGRARRGEAGSERGSDGVIGDNSEASVGIRRPIGRHNRQCRFVPANLTCRFQGKFFGNANAADLRRCRCA